MHLNSNINTEEKLYDLLEMVDEEFKCIICRCENINNSYTKYHIDALKEAKYELEIVSRIIDRNIDILDHLDLKYNDDAMKKQIDIILPLFNKLSSNIDNQIEKME